MTGVKSETRKQDTMIWNQIGSQWLRMRELVKSKRESLYRAVKDDWLAKLRLKDRYAEKRPPSS